MWNGRNSTYANSYKWLHGSSELCTSSLDETLTELTWLSTASVIICWLSQADVSRWPLLATTAPSSGDSLPPRSDYCTPQRTNILWSAPRHTSEAVDRLRHSSKSVDNTTQSRIISRQCWLTTYCFKYMLIEHIFFTDLHCQTVHLNCIKSLL